MCECKCDCSCPPQHELKAGDWVRDILTDDILKIEAAGNADYPFMVHHSISGDYIASMTKDGKHCTSHKYPRFVKCDPPKQKHKVTVERFATVYRGNGATWNINGEYFYGGIYDSANRANAVCSHSAIIAKVTMTFEFED